jgi:Transposase IS4
VRSVHAGEASETVLTPGDIALLEEAALFPPFAEEDGAGQQSSPLLTVPGSQAPAPPAAAIQSTIVVHGTEWIHGKDELSVNGPVRYRPWALRTPTGETLSAAGGIGERSALDLLRHMFPPLQLQEMRRLTTRELQAKVKTPTTPGEILKYLGVLLLMTRSAFDERASLWATNQEHAGTSCASYQSPPAPPARTSGGSSGWVGHSRPAGAHVANARYCVHRQSTKQRGPHGSIDHVYSYKGIK